jgi:hypothetical protein
MGSCEVGLRFCSFFGLFSLLETALIVLASVATDVVLSCDSNLGKLLRTDFLQDFALLNLSIFGGSSSMLSKIIASAPAVVSGVLRCEYSSASCTTAATASCEA